MPSNLPTITLSIRQPWAWLIVNGFKDIENRDWQTKRRGPVLIHASKGITRDEYGGCFRLCESLGVKLPAFEELERGGIVGVATITDCVDQSESPWFFGKYGFVLSNARPLPFIPYKGRLGFFSPDIEVIR